MTEAPPPPSAPVLGVGVDPQTRCAHYGTERDVVALRFACCAVYWPCHLCHAALADHPAVPVPARDAGLPRVLCGVCRTELSVDEYRAATGAAGDAGRAADPRCPACGAGFNPGCAAHAHLYFEDPRPGGRPPRRRGRDAAGADARGAGACR